MNSPTVYIGGFAYELGENEAILEDLDEIRHSPDQIARLRSAGFERYRTSNLSVLELAGKAIDRLFAKISIAPSEIDAVIFVTSSFGVNNHLSHQTLCTFLLEHKLDKAYPFTSSLSFCGNFLPALRTGYNYVKTRDFKNVLVIVSDIIPKNSSKLTPPDIAVGSDGAACCVLSVNNFSNFEIRAFYQAVNAQSGLLDPDKDFLKYTKAVGDGIKEVAKKTCSMLGGTEGKLTKVFTNNYSKNVCRSFLRLINVPETKLHENNIPRFGHAGAADICINIHDYLETKGPSDNESLLLLSSGPFMWGSALISSIS